MLTMTNSGKRILLDPSTRRLTFCIAVSVLAHIAITWGTGRTASRYQRPAPLQVEIRTFITESREPLTNPGILPEIDAPVQAQEMTQPAIAPLKSNQPADTPNALTLPMDVYYLSSEVDIRAEPLNEVNLVYPLKPYQQRIRGSVRLHIFVNERGGIDKIVMVDAKPAGLFEEAALEAVTKLEFSPAIKNGVPVKNRKTVEVNFDPYERAITPKPSAAEK